MREQAPAPNPYHCFCMVAEDLNDLVRHFDKLKIPHYVATEHLNTQEARSITGRRIFVGRPKDDSTAYDPAFDLNVMMEILSLKETPIWTLPQGTTPPFDALPRGAFVRMESWSLLVPDIVKAATMLGKNFHLWPAPGSVVIDIPEEGVKSMMIQIGRQQGTKLELLSPLDDGKAIGRWCSQFGMRLFHIRFLVNDLDTRLRDLDRRGIGFELREPGKVLPYRRAWINPEHAMGANFEFVDYADYVQRWGGPRPVPTGGWLAPSAAWAQAIAVGRRPRFAEHAQ